MVRFSCFNGHINSHKPKKIEQPSVEAMRKTSEDCTQNHASKNLTIETCSSSSKVQGDIPTNGSGSRTSSIECSWKAEDIKGKITEGTLEVVKTSQLKKSQSLGSGLYLEDKISAENDIGSEVDQEFSCDGSHDHNEFAEGKEQGGRQPDLYEKDVTKDSKVGSEILNDGSTFSIDNATHSEKEDIEISDALLSGEDAGESHDHSPRTPRMIVRFCSLPNIGASVAPYANLLHSRSFEDLHDWYLKRKGISDEHLEQEQTRCNDVRKTDKNNFEISVDGGYDSSHCSASTKEWIMPVLDELHAMKNLHDELSAPQESLNKDFRIKRIEEWVNALEHCSLIEEASELSQSSEQVKEHSMSNELTASKLENKVTPGMEAAKRYISSLTANASTAQLANHGLVVIPFLSAFVSLRVLNLSGNAIVRITSGTLPRGLHTLNLSKNNISYIDGLRELTRLRVLDLSYNKILRIGHGLASCSSLKELYLAGNKISEVEGLHRLLKLTVLDLRFNKISTAKCLGQLAANYISLQAISLEGNPAQKNVGDEQLKKHLQGLLPQLVYYNRQAIKVSSLKDVADRSVRLNMSSHQLDRGLRLDHKGTRKGSQRPSSSFSVHSRGSQASVVSQKHSRGRHVRFPPGKTKATTRHHYLDSGSKALNLKAEHSIRRSRSEGSFGAL